MNEERTAENVSKYDLDTLRDLVREAFTAEELRRFCQDQPAFRPLLVDVPTRAGADELVNTVIHFCEANGLLGDLCAAIKEAKPRQYERIEPNLFALHETATRRRGLHLSAPMQAPLLPVQFIPRPEISAALKTRLLSDEEPSPGTARVTAIQGVSGAGKSVLAAELARRSEVQGRFQDGILWATLGQQPDMLALLSGWIQSLGSPAYWPLRVEDATAQLRTLLQAKACLLVVDEVLDAADAEPFLAGDAGCRALVITRRADVTEALAGEHFLVDPMTDQQSLALLAARLGRPLHGAEQAEALEVARAVDCLPLALELTAARVATGVTWSNLRVALLGEVTRQEAPENALDRRGQP